jgi:hypothetical protein
MLTTYGLTRWFVTYCIVREDVRRFNESHVRELSSGNRLFKMIANVGGWDMWVSAAIACCAGGVALLFAAYYLFKLGDPMHKDKVEPSG